VCVMRVRAAQCSGVKATLAAEREQQLLDDRTMALCSLFLNPCHFEF
jgi:hypothetical protein